MKKLSRLGALLLSAAAAATMLASCTGNSTDSNTSGSGDGNKEIPTLTWYQIGGEPTNLKAGVDKINEYIADKVGAKVNIVYYGWDDYDTKTNNMLNTGEYFDIMFVNETKYTGFAAQGKYLALDDKLGGVAPELKSLVTDELWTGVKVNGKIYGVPTAKDCAATQYFAFDKAMLDKYELDLGTLNTFANVEAALKKIKAGEEAATGKKVYPFYLHKEGYTAWKTSYDNYVRYDDATATAKNIYESAELTELFTMLHRWYEEGLINPDASTLGESPKYRICFTAQSFDGAEVGWEADRGYKIVQTPYTDAILSTNTILGSVNAVSANTKYPDECLKFLQLANTDTKLRNMIAYGVEGANWKDNGDGTISRLDDNYTPATYCQASTWTMSPESPNPSDMYTKLKTVTAGAKTHVLLGFTFDPNPVATEYANVNAAIKKYEAELYSGVYSGTTADYLKKFNDDLKANGLDALLAEIQKQVNAFLGK